MRKLTITKSVWLDEDYRACGGETGYPDSPQPKVDTEVHENLTPMEAVDILRKEGLEFRAVNYPAWVGERDGIFGADAGLPDGSREFYGVGVSDWVAVPVAKVEEITARLQGFSKLTTEVIIARVDAR
ncbi:hypothetical protein PXH69_24340 [Rhodococcus qingshengii]|uniref:Uncharacterized protein n=1 Tax=Rhodococcus qingshengii TaxID=334542 RepID=A0AAW6LRV1_RHOSG|nr:hypothetical protein [Rhodococcus qingshengii]MDE8648100.1 hypothetical protein [Rhodococcus qingshengii]